MDENSSGRAVLAARPQPEMDVPAARERPRVPVLMPRTVATGLALVSGDVTGLLTSGPSLRYALVFGALTISTFADVHATRRRGSVLVTVPFVALAAWLTLLWLSAITAGQWQPNTLVVIYAAVVLALAATNMLLPGRRGRAGRSHRWERGVYAAALIFAVVSAVDAAAGETGSPVNLLSHERTFVSLYVLSLPKRRFTWVMRLTMLTALVISFVQYAAATTLLTVALAVAVAVIVHCSRHPVALTLTSSVLAGGLVLSGVAESVLGFFYSASGRVDNTSTREYLWAQALDIVDEGPVAGGATRISIAYLANIDGRISYAPIHNSYLTVMVVGGVVACALLVVGLTGLVLAGLARPLEERRDFGSQWLPAYIAVAVSMIVNPVIDKLGASLFFIVLTLVGLGFATRIAPADPET